MNGDLSANEVTSVEQSTMPVGQPQSTKPTRSGKAPIIIMSILIVCLLGVIGVGAWFYLNQTKCAPVVSANTSSAESSETAVTSDLLSNDVYKIYTYKHESTNVNGDACDTNSILSLYKDQNIAVLSDSSCLGGEVKVGTYDVYSDKVAIEFKTRIGLEGIDGQSRLNLREDISGNVVTMVINNDGTATSTLFTGDRLYTKR